jgi:hypothetical protein
MIYGGHDDWDVKALKKKVKKEMRKAESKAIHEKVNKDMQDWFAKYPTIYFMLILFVIIGACLVIYKLGGEFIKAFF